MSKLKTMVALVLAGIAVMLFHSLDKGLSGGSAQPGWLFVAYMLVVLVAMVVVTVSNDNETANFVGMAIALAPLAAVMVMFFSTNMAFSNRPEAVERREWARNARCAVRKLDVAKTDRGYIRVRIGMIEDYGDTPNKSTQRELEDRLGAHILPGCNSRPLRPEDRALPEPAKVDWPDNASIAMNGAQ